MSRSPAKSGNATAIKSLKEKWSSIVQSVREKGEKGIGGFSTITDIRCSYKHSPLPSPICPPYWTLPPMKSLSTSFVSLLLWYEDWTLSSLLYIGPCCPLTCRSCLPCPLFSLQTLIDTLSGKFSLPYELTFHHFLSWWMLFSQGCTLCVPHFPLVIFLP